MMRAALHQLAGILEQISRPAHAPDISTDGHIEEFQLCADGRTGQKSCVMARDAF
jgi:hypothetical protein